MTHDVFSSFSVILSSSLLTCLLKTEETRHTECYPTIF